MPTGSSQQTIYAYLTSTDSSGSLSVKHMLRCFSKLEPGLFFLPQGHISRTMILIPEGVKRN